MLRIPDGTVHLNAWAHCRLEAFSNAFRSATEDDYAHDVRGLAWPAYATRRVSRLLGVEFVAARPQRACVVPSAPGFVGLLS